ASGQSETRRDRFDVRLAVDVLFSQQAVGDAHELLHNVYLLRSPKCNRRCMTASAESPAPRSSTTMPVPSGSRSNRRIGNGFQISKTRKSIRPARKVFQASGTAMSVTNCPATSSMTTNCGSFRPEDRATSVAAGIPMRVAAAAATMVAEVRLVSGIRELANAHSTAVANDAQVPGPGLRRPAPKKVATSVAHNAAWGRDAGATVEGRGGGWVAARHVTPSSSAAGVRASRPHTGSDGSPVAVLVAAFTTGPLYRWLGPRLCLRHRHPATKSRTRRWPKRFMK